MGTLKEEHPARLPALELARCSKRRNRLTSPAPFPTAKAIPQCHNNLQGPIATSLLRLVDPDLACTSQGCTVCGGTEESTVGSTVDTAIQSHECLVPQVTSVVGFTYSESTA